MPILCTILRRLLVVLDRRYSFPKSVYCTVEEDEESPISWFLIDLETQKELRETPFYYSQVRDTHQ